MSAPEVLRRAATLIRQRANAATPSPWTAGKEIDGVRAGRATVAHAHGKRVFTVDQTRPHHDREAEANIVHASAWSPAVALAIADLLDDQAEYAEMHLNGVPYQVDNDWIERNYRAPLAIARTYLDGAA